VAAVSGRAYLSIGDVLTLLRQEFPDVTISKIRFLESQGLVDPERTPSGYRKFYEQDVERLRWVLRQQREHFLPLKVIKGRLAEGGEEDDNGVAAEEPALVGELTGRADSGRAAGRGEPLPGFEGQRPGRGQPHPAARSATAPTSAPAGDPASPTTEASPRAAAAKTEPAASGVRQRQAGAGAPAQRSASPSSAAPPAPAAAAASPTSRRPARPPAEPPAVLAEGDTTAEELAEASGCTTAALGELESFGLIAGRLVGGVVYYGADALEVARLAAGFAAYGVEARHLRLHKHAVDREAGFIEQVVLPLLKQRNPESRQRAHDTVAELSRLGQALRAVLLRSSLRDQLGG